MVFRVFLVQVWTSEDPLWLGRNQIEQLSEIFNTPALKLLTHPFLFKGQVFKNWTKKGGNRTRRRKYLYMNSSWWDTSELSQYYLYMNSSWWHITTFVICQDLWSHQPAVAMATSELGLPAVSTEPTLICLNNLPMNQLSELRRATWSQYLLDKYIKLIHTVMVEHLAYY